MLRSPPAPSSRPRSKRVAIVGGGASGVLVALALARRSSPPDVTIFEPRAELGCGYAGPTSRREHLMNVPAGRLSVDAEQPADFVTWCAANGIVATVDTFVPRPDFGRYLADRSSARAAHVMQRVVDIDRRPDGRFDVRAPGGPQEPFDDVVMATGYGPSPGARTLVAVESPLVVRDPYGPDAFAGIPPVGTFVVVGTGLTAIDVILSLGRDRPAQQVIAVSRRGRTPAFHELDVAPVEVVMRSATARGLVREVRAVATDVEARGGDWRALIDSVRHQLPAIWRRLPQPERSRLLRHARRPWDLHRHRLAPAVAAELAPLMADGRVSIRRGRPIDVRADASGVSVVLADGGATTVVDAAGLVLCTGVIDDDWTAADPLLGRLLERGLVAGDPLGIGPAVDRRGRLVGRSGAPTAGLWAVGPLRRASEWEVTAIPEIRRQAAELAGGIAP